METDSGQWAAARGVGVVYLDSRVMLKDEPVVCSGISTINMYIMSHRLKQDTGS